MVGNRRYEEEKLVGVELGVPVDVRIEDGLEGN